MAKITEHTLPVAVREALAGGSREGLAGLGLDAAVDPKTIIEAIDRFVFDWQDGKRPPPGAFDEPDDVPVALGCLWGDQLVRVFGWEWVLITFDKRDEEPVPAIVSADRSLAVYPIHFVTGALEDSDVDFTIALSYNMLEAGTAGKPKPKGLSNLMDGVHRIVPRRA